MSLWTWLTRLVREQVDSYESKGSVMLFMVTHTDVLTLHEAGISVKEEARGDTCLRIGSCPSALDVREADETPKIGD